MVPLQNVNYIRSLSGIHAVLVPIRDKDLNVLPSVRVEEMGYKMGLNGVDNAKLTFDNVRGLILQSQRWQISN